MKQVSSARRRQTFISGVAALSSFVLLGIALAGCGSSSSTISATSPYNGTYVGTWSFNAAASNSSAATDGGPVTLTVSKSGAVVATFTDTIGSNSFTANAIVDSTGTITFVPPTSGGGILVGEPTFSGTVTTNSFGALIASGTLSYDYPGSGSWSAARQ